MQHLAARNILRVYLLVREPTQPETLQMAVQLCRFQAIVVFSNSGVLSSRGIRR
jgi:hypothetical protein